MPQFRLSFAMCRKVRPLRRYPFLRMAELPALPRFITFRLTIRPKVANQENQRIRTLLCTSALLLAGPAFAHSATGGQEMAPAEQDTPPGSARPSPVVLPPVGGTQVPSYDGDN